jgi:hypothetical protein
MEQIETVEIVKVFARRVWIESDFSGDKHVMIQHQDGESEPFCYCSFHYDYAYTSNSAIREQAERMAIQLGAVEPVEYKSRPFGFNT